MDYTPDKFARTVSIPIKVVKGQVRLLYGGICLPLNDGSVGDLVLPAAAVRDQELLHLLEAENTVEVLPACSVVLLAMRGIKMPPERTHNVFVLRHSALASHFAYAPVVLIQPLSLLLRGTKLAQLLGGMCRIPGLHEDASSLNHAYTLLSTVLEPSRRAHTGNVFDRACYYDGGQWRKLDDLRAKHEKLREQEIIAYLTPKQAEPPASLLLPDTQSALDLDVSQEVLNPLQQEHEPLVSMVNAYREPQANHEHIDAAMHTFIAQCYNLSTLYSAMADWPTGR